MINDSVFYDDIDIRYLLQPSAQSNHLIITFSGYAIHPEKKAVYNFINTLENCNHNKLFILDDQGFEGRGCWYLGEAGTYTVESSTYKLIQFICEKLNIGADHVILCGTSKGGFAALHFGTKYNFKNIIVGAPQIFLGKYLNGFPNILKSIQAPDEQKEKCIYRLNNTILNNNIKNKNIIIGCGNKDHHLKGHIIPFLEQIDLKDNNISLIITEGTHDSIGAFFQKNIVDLIDKLINEQIEWQDSVFFQQFSTRDIIIEDLKQHYTTKSIKLKLLSNTSFEIHLPLIDSRIEYACYVVDNKNNAIQKHLYQQSPIFKIDHNGQTDLKLRIYFKANDEKRTHIELPIKFSLNFI